MKHIVRPVIALALVAAMACSGGSSGLPPEGPGTPGAVPAWAADAVFYQVFPERFRNGDPSNDPTRASLERHSRAPATWAVTPWTSDWYERAPWEEAMGDGFNDGVFDRRYGGDLQGVLDELDYLRGLGVNALYFNPLFWARSLHKYDGNTFHHIDPYFGPDPGGDLALIAAEDPANPAAWRWTAADSLFLRLIAAAHERGIRVVIDGVFNHTGLDFFAFADLREHQQASPYRDWYVVKSFDDPATAADEFDWEGWWGYKPLALLADNADGTDLQPGPRQYVFDATARWMDPDGDGDPADGIDGWRLDVAGEMPVRFWADWNAHVRRLNPEAYTVAEVWEDAAAFLDEAGFSATMNYYGFAFLVKGFLIDGTMPAGGFVDALNTRREAYPEARRYALLNLIDSHDTDRLASMIVNAGAYDTYLAPDRFDYDWGERVAAREGANTRYRVRAPDARERRIQRLTALFQMAYVGAPMVYYGTEAGMWGADDPDDRMPMVWPDLAYEPQAADPLGRARTPDPVAFDSALYDYYRGVIALRRGHASLRRGGFRVLATDGPARTLAFMRTYEDEVLVVVLNRSEQDQAVRLRPDDVLATPSQGLAPIFATDGRADAYPVTAEGDALLVRVPALTGIVLHRTGIE